ncbi:hypothetical protein QJQ45_022701, partial [Haematococcus lacustris]
SRSLKGKQRQERRNGWETKRRQVIKVPGGAVLRGCKKTKRKLLAHLQSQAEVHSQLHVHLAAASSAGTSLVANLKHVTVTLATWAAVWEVYLDPKWARQRLRLYGSPGPCAGAVLQAVAPRNPPQAPCSSQKATQPAASEPGPSTPPPAKGSKRTEAEQAAEPTQPTKAEQAAELSKGKAAKAKPAPQPGRWLDRDCNAALNMHWGEQVAPAGAVLVA